MKISFRILIINFAIVFLIIGSAAAAFYSVMYNVLTTQQSKLLLESANDFIYSYRETVVNLEDDFQYIQNNRTNEEISSRQLNEKNIDFIIRTGPDGNKIQDYSISAAAYLPENIVSAKEFFTNNPYNITITSKDKDGSVYYYGKIVDKEFLDNLSKRIKSEIALIWNDSPAQVSNESQNQKYIYSLTKAYSELSTKNNFDIYTRNSETSDLLVTIYKPSVEVEKGSNNVQFLIFSPLNAAADLRNSLRDILIIIGFSGVLLSLILTYIFTDKIRKQITDLSKATEVTKGGNFNTRITVKSKDELGDLANAFNIMLLELEKNQRSRNEYSEFITLINQNPTLKEISEASLKKIILSCGFNVGALYTIEDDVIAIASSFGVEKGDTEKLNIELFSTVIKNKTPLEFTFNENIPVVSTGILKIELKHLLILPVVYNNNVIAILELGGTETPSAEVREYLAKIQEQLAIGLTNAMAFVQLEKLVSELKQLNEDYQKQNVQIRKQNETLVDLHSKLKDKADELEIQKSKAEESTQLKSQFLASMSHELRTPMNSILGLTELVLEEPAFKGRNRERLEVVLKSGKRLMNLINDILDLSKIEAGKMEIREEDVFLDELLKEVEHSVSPLLINKKISFRTLKENNSNIFIKTDRGKVTQVLINLLGNAIKFTEMGYIELKIRTDMSNGVLSFDISDTGIGISEENQKIIFEEFRQVDGTTNKKYNGTGLGLTICKRIATILNGDLSVRSKPGQGSTFTFSIPLNYLNTAVREDRISQFKDVPYPQKKPILIIDDDAEVRFTIGEYLVSKGYEVIYAEDGEKGIQSAIDNQPFAITVDILLPSKDGWEVLKELKQNPKTKDIPVILISIVEEKNIGYGLGAYEYLIKPFTTSQLELTFSKLESVHRKKVEKITIVDDDELEFEKFRSEFKNEKIRIDYIKDSEFAFSKILETQPDLIIIDLIMPNVDGISLTYKLKANRETRHIPIIISTAKDITSEEKRSLNNIVENISVKSKGHPMDVLKVVRDRIKLQENFSAEEIVPVFISEEHVSENITISSNNDLPAIGEVLAIDDDPDTLFTVNEILVACQCKTYLAKGGKEALKVLDHVTPDLILLDIMMPEMDGFQTIKKIRENPRFSGVPIFAVTAKAMLEDKEIILKNGFDDYIPKPINSSVLAFKIKKALSQKVS